MAPPEEPAQAAGPTSSQPACGETLEALVQEKDLWEQTFGALPDPIVVLDREYRILRANRAMAHRLGLAPKDCVGGRCYKAVHGTDEPPSSCPHTKLLADGGEHQAQMPIDALGGEFLVSVVPIFDAEGQLLGGMHVARDVTQARQSERRLAITNQIAEVFLTVPDEEMYADVLEIVLQALESPHGVFGYINEEGDLVCPSMTRDVWEQCQLPEKDIVFPRETWGGIWGTSLVEKRTVCANRPCHPPEGHIPIRRCLDVCIVHQGKAIGHLAVGNKATDYDKRDISLLEGIANHVAPILSARLRRRTEERARRRAEEALRDSEERLRSLVENAPNVIATADRNGTILSINRPPEGQTIEETIGTTVYEHVDPRDHEAIRKAVDHVFRTGSPAAYECRVPAPGRGPLWFEVELGPLRRGDRVAAATFVCTNITPYKQARGALEIANKQLIVAREEERRRLASELHDSIGQELVALKMALQTPYESQECPARLRALGERCARLIREVRDLCHGLYPATLESLGLAAALRELQRSQAPGARLSVSWAGNLAEERFGREQEIALFRIVQEAASNALRHGEADKIDVSAERGGSAICVTIADNGCGFDPARPPRQGLGLQTMRDRVTALGGTLEITSGPTGTQVVACVPVAPDDPAPGTGGGGDP